MLKKILCIALVVAIVGSAIGFIVYDKVGKTYNYENKDMAKYILTALSAEKIKEIYEALDRTELGDPEQIAAGNDKIAYKIAEAIAALDKTKKDNLEGGKLAIYDEVTFLYYIVLEDGTVVSDPTMMNLSNSKLPSIQIGSDPEDSEWVELLGNQLKDQNYQLFKNSIIESGKVEATDTIWVEYTVNKYELDADNNIVKDDSGNNKIASSTTYKYQMTTLAGLDSLKAGDTSLAGLTAAFTAKQDEIVAATKPNEIPKVIGTGKLNPDDSSATALISDQFKGLAVTDTTVSVDLKILWASRALVTSGDIVDGDTVYFTYKEKDNKDAKAVQLVTTKSDAGKAELLSIFKSDDFYNKLMELKVGDDNKDIEITITTPGEEGAEPTETKKTYTISIDYAVPADVTVEREGLTNSNPAMGPFEVTFPEDTEMKQYDATGKVVTENKTEDGKDTTKDVTLAGKKAKVYVYVADGKHVDYATASEELSVFETIYELLGYKAPYTEAAEDAEEDAKKAAADQKIINEYFKAVSDLKTAEKNLKTETDKGESADATKVTELTTKRDEAKTELTKKTEAYNELKGVAKDTVRNADDDIRAEYEEYQRKVVQKEVNSEYGYKLAKLIWDATLAEVKKGEIKYPSRAVKLAKKGIMDTFKTEYYSKRETTYKDSKTFNSYLKSLGENDDTIEATAKEQVLETMLVHYLGDSYGVYLTEDDLYDSSARKNTDRLMLQFYGQKAPSGYYEARETMTLFDRLMEKIVEDLVPSIDNDKIY